MLFPLLADPSAYRPCEADLLVDASARGYWLELFARQLQAHLDAAEGLGVPAERREAARARLLAELAALAERPDRHGRLDILLLDEIRDAALHRAGIEDAFSAIKARENERALAALPGHLAVIDDTAEADRLPSLARCLLAGNFFDMGAPATSREFGEGPVSFESVLARVPPRPWLVDDLDATNRRWLEAPPARAVVFVDNAGADLILGALPLVREMLRRGVGVVVAANSRPSLNDVTFEELRVLAGRAAEIDPAFRDGRLTLVPSGNGAPLIDLRDVTPELAGAARGAGLLVLLGMGRAIESNYSARFTCETWKIAMIKDPHVAGMLGGKVFDAVFKGEPAE